MSDQNIQDKIKNNKEHKMTTEDEYDYCINKLKAIAYLLDGIAYTAVYEDDINHLEYATVYLAEDIRGTIASLEVFKKEFTGNVNQNISEVETDNKNKE